MFPARCTMRIIASMKLKVITLKLPGYRTEPRSLTSSSQEVIEDITPAVPANLAPGPNTKVTTTIKTYTYELPGAPDTYLNSSTLAKNIDKSVSYILPKDSTTQKTITYEVLK